MRTKVAGPADPRPLRRRRTLVLTCMSIGALGWLLWPAPDPALGDAAGAATVAALDPRLPPLPFGSGPPLRGPDRDVDAAASAKALPPAAPPRADDIAPGGYEATMNRFYELRWSDVHSAELQALARVLNRDLSATLARGEIAPDDALLLKADLLDLLEPSAARRGAMLVQWRERHLAASNAGDPDADRRRDAAIVARWQAQPSEERDPGELEEALEASRPGGGTR